MRCIWPALIRFALPLTAWTLGLGALALNGLFVWLAAEIIGHGFDVDRVWQGVLLAIWLTVDLGRRSRRCSRSTTTRSCTEAS